MADVTAAHERMRAAELARALAAQQRAEAIRRALEQGLTLAEIGRRLGGLSAQRIAQMKGSRARGRR